LVGVGEIVAHGWIESGTPCKQQSEQQVAPNDWQTFVFMALLLFQIVSFCILFWNA
jgi:nitrate reductase NapE component